jgi:hypothetical protein
MNLPYGKASMIKLVALIKRRSDITPEAFRDYYEHRHALLFRESIPPEVADAIASYTHNHAVELGGSSAEHRHDCVTEFRFDDLVGLRMWSDWYLGDGGKVLRDDEENFMDLSQRVVIVTEERNIGVGR